MRYINIYMKNVFIHKNGNIFTVGDHFLSEMNPAFYYEIIYINIEEQKINYASRLLSTEANPVIHTGTFSELNKVSLTKREISI